MKNNFKKKDIILTLIFSSLLTAFYFVSAQNVNDVLITWQTQTYQPSGYLGKNLPTLGSPIIAAVELVENQKLIDLSNSNIKWYVDNSFFAQGAGLKRITFNTDALIGATVTLEVNISPLKEKEKPPADYLNTNINNIFDEPPLLVGIISIPVVKPEVVIDAPYADKIITNGVNFLQAMPYFFNIKGLNDLIFNWTVNDHTVSGSADNPQILELTVNSELTQTDIVAKAALSNVNNVSEFAVNQIQLTAKQ